MILESQHETNMKVSHSEKAYLKMKRQAVSFANADSLEFVLINRQPRRVFLDWPHET